MAFGLPCTRKLRLSRLTDLRPSLPVLPLHAVVLTAMLAVSTFSRALALDFEL